MARPGARSKAGIGEPIRTEFPDYDERSLGLVWISKRHLGRPLTAGGLTAGVFGLTAGVADLAAIGARSGPLLENNHGHLAASALPGGP